jgi:hypothetical protein
MYVQGVSIRKVEQITEARLSVHRPRLRVASDYGAATTSHQ